MPKNQLGHVNPFLLMDLDGDSVPVVVDANAVVLDVDVDLDGVHGWIALLVVGGVDEDLVEDLVKAGDVGDGAGDHSGVIIVDPEGLVVLLDGADVGVGAEKDVLELGLLLVGLFDRLLAVPRVEGVAVLQGELLLYGCHGREKKAKQDTEIVSEREREREKRNEEWKGLGLYRDGEGHNGRQILKFELGGMFEWTGGMGLGGSDG